MQSYLKLSMKKLCYIKIYILNILIIFDFKKMSRKTQKKFQYFVLLKDYSENNHNSRWLRDINIQKNQAYCKKI